jgi:predicted Ser/Thr protein kinase
MPPQTAQSATQAYGGATSRGLDLAAGIAEQLPVLLGRYQLRKLLGQGGMGAVYLAHDTQLDRPVALKIPSFASAGNSARERFIQEARAAATVLHPNLCPVYDAGTIDGVEYLTMAFIEGKPLSALIRDGRPLSERTAAMLVRQLALAMQAAHDKGIIHRDLKPDNIMITPKKQPVIMDFGLARRELGPQATRLTQAGHFLGTPAYMPPEQVNGDLQAMGPGCDIYSLGVVLYQLLTGRLPFDPAGGLGTLMGQIVLDEPPPPSRFRPGLSPGLEVLCLKTLAKKPEHRPRSMTELAKELENFLRGQGGATPASGEDPAKLVFAQMLSANTEVAPRPSSLSRPRRRRRWPWLVGIGSGAALLLALLLVLLLHGSKDGMVVIELSTPRADVDVFVDGQRIDPGVVGQPLPLEAGEHQLKVRGLAFEPVAQSFTVRASREVLVPVTLKPRQQVAAGRRPLTPVKQETEPEQPGKDDPAKNDPVQQAPKEDPPKEPLKPPKSPVPGQPLPVPGEEAVQKAREEIRQAHLKEYARQSRIGWVAVAERLRGQADETRDNPLRRYALWQEARQLAIQAAATTLAIRISEDLARAFTVDGLALKAATLHGVDQVLANPGPALVASERPQRNHLLARQALDVMDAALGARKFNQAFDLLQLARQAENRAKEDGDLPLVTASMAELQALKPSFARLQQDPNDGVANFAVGRLLCLSEGRWQAGLPLLAKANDPLWQAAAKSELSQPADAAGHVAVGDAWKQLFDRNRGLNRSGLGRHARSWYDLALTELPPAKQRPVLIRVLQIGGAPNLSRIKPFFDADAADVRSGLPVHKLEPDFKMDSDYARGRWFMKTPEGFWHGGDVTRSVTPFACQVVARVVDPPSAAWDLLFANPMQKHSYAIRVDGTGAVQVLFFDERTKPAMESTLAAPKPRGLKPRLDFRTLLVVARARQLDLYLDGVPLLNVPVRLPRDVGPGQIHLGVVSGNAGGGHMEVKRLTVWPADAVPALGARP